MADVMAFVEQRERRIAESGREVVAAAYRVAASRGGRARGLVLGGPGTSEGAEGLGHYGAASVAVGEHEEIAEYNPEAYAPIVVDHIRKSGYAVVIFSATSLGKDLAPRVAAHLDVPLASDVTGIDVGDGIPALERPVFAGKVFARVVIDASPVLLSIRPNAFPVSEVPVECEVSTFVPDIDTSSWRMRVIERQREAPGVLDVSEAQVIVSGGRGLKDPSNWGLLEGLRDALGPSAALGASRAVVDAGWRPHGEQVGQTGKTVSPELYIAVGISGAMQHLAGMRTAKTIVAINQDRDAPIFGVADYGVVGDLFEIVPRLTEEVVALKAGS